MVDFTKDLAIFSQCARQRLSRESADVFQAKINDSKPAAVLIPIVDRAQGLQVLLTQRSKELPTHAGQIAFPGGKIDTGDASPLAAALRETHEETGIAPQFVSPIGYLRSFETGTGFHISPVVGSLAPGFEIIPEPGEVTEVFEVPLDFLMDPQNHQRKSMTWNGKLRSYDAIPYQDRYIWGVTARMLVDLYGRMSGDD